MKRFILMVSAWFALPSCLLSQPTSIARLEVFPARRILHAPSATQQLAVIAHFKDGTKRDVTRLTRFTSSDEEIATIHNGLVRFGKTGEVAILCRYHTLHTIRLTYVDPKPGFLWPDPPEHNPIDRLVFAKLKQLSLVPSDLCSDQVFVRRAYRDLCGIHPTPREIKRFLSDVGPDKRNRLIDELLNRPEYSELWAHHWADALALPFGYQKPKLGMVYLHWLRGHVKQDVPLDEFVRAIVKGNGAITEDGPVSFYTGATEPAEWAARTSEAFLGIRLQCVQCHALADSRWTVREWYPFAAFFSQVTSGRFDVGKKKIEIILLDSQREWMHPVTKKPIVPRFPDGMTPKLQIGRDRREALADWLTAPQNPFFARTMANRIWANLLGKGIAHPPEMLHELPLTANDELIDLLAKALIAERFDAKSIIRLIMRSRTYQLESATNQFNKDDAKYFSHAYRLAAPAEVGKDLIAEFVEVPHEFDGVPPGTRAIQMLLGPIPEGPFVRRHRSLCPADERSTPLSILFELNSSEMQAKLAHPNNRVGRLLREKRTDREILDDIFLAAFARLPKDSDRELAAKHLAGAKSRRLGHEDILWAVINTKEFLCRP